AKYRKRRRNIRRSAMFICLRRARGAILPALIALPRRIPTPPRAPHLSLPDKTAESVSNSARLRRLADFEGKQTRLLSDRQELEPSLVTIIGEIHDRRRIGREHGQGLAGRQAAHHPLGAQDGLGTVQSFDVENSRHG